MTRGADQTSAWEDRFGELLDAEGEEWDRLHEQIEEDWKREYRAAFIAEAVRLGWDRQVATDWAEDSDDAAFSERDHDDPAAAADADVASHHEEMASA